MRRLLILVCALLVGSSFTPVASSQTAPDDVQRTVLSNGLVLLTKVRPDPDSVAINVAVRAGSRDEDETTNGAAHFMEHMFFQGTRADLARSTSIGRSPRGAAVSTPPPAGS